MTELESKNYMCGCGIACNKLNPKTKVCGPLGTMTGQFRRCPIDHIMEPIKIDKEDSYGELVKKIQDVSTNGESSGNDLKMLHSEIDRISDKVIKDTKESIAPTVSCPIHGENPTTIHFSAKVIGGTRYYCLACWIKAFECELNMRPLVVIPMVKREN